MHVTSTLHLLLVFSGSNKLGYLEIHLSYLEIQYIQQSRQIQRKGMTLFCVRGWGRRDEEHVLL